MIFDNILAMIVLIHLDESASHPSSSPRGSAPSCAFARRQLIQMRFLCVQMRSRQTPADQNAVPVCVGRVHLGSKMVFDLDADRNVSK